MGTVKEFTELEVWKMARTYCVHLNSHFTKSTWSSQYALKNQLDRSSGSIMDNIAEGFDRGGNKEFMQFLSIAKGSCGETISQIYRAFDKELLTEEDKEQLIKEGQTIKAKIGAFMNYLKKSERKGFKYD